MDSHLLMVSGVSSCSQQSQGEYNEKGSKAREAANASAKVEIRQDSPNCDGGRL
jgi:hypothetical protein